MNSRREDYLMEKEGEGSEGRQVVESESLPFSDESEDLEGFQERKVTNSHRLSDAVNSENFKIPEWLKQVLIKREACDSVD